MFFAVLVPSLLGRQPDLTRRVGVQHGGPPAAHQGCQPLLQGIHTVMVPRPPPLDHFKRLIDMVILKLFIKHRNNI